MTSSAELFAAAGRALFGVRWKADMAFALEVSIDRFDDWSKGRGRPPPRGVWTEIEDLMRERSAELQKLMPEVNRAVQGVWLDNLRFVANQPWRAR
jgi:hypothetical protein